jgi:hypothetical protein
VLKAVKTVARKAVNLESSLVVRMAVRSAQSLVVHLVEKRVALLAVVKAETWAELKGTCSAGPTVGW